MSDYRSMSIRIAKCSNNTELDKCEKSLTRLYHNGIFTVLEFYRLDTLVINKRIELEK